MKSTLSLNLALAVLAAYSGGCAPPLPPRMVRASEVGQLRDFDPSRPLVVEFVPGDVLPLEFELTGPLLKTPDGAPSIPLTAQRHFFLRIDKNGLKSSFDPRRFDRAPVVPGHFMIGFGVTRAGASAKVSVETPMPAPPK